MSTSVAYLRKRLADIGRHDLLAAADRGDISTFAAAEAAGLIRTARSRVTGNGSGNQARRRRWAIARATGQAPPLPPKPEPQPETGPVSPLPQEIRDIVVKLVKLDRADLIIAVAERRMDPHQAEAIADRDVHGRTESQKQGDNVTLKRGGKRKAVPVEPEKPKIDVRCLIA
jgi:hypothetical protein